MAYFFHFVCTECGIKINTSGPHEINFSNGKIIPLPHPGTDRCDGLLFRAFCNDCKTNQDIIIVAFKTRSDPWEQKKENIREEYLINYIEAGHQEDLFGPYIDLLDNDIIYTELYRRDLPCPACNSRNVILFPEKNKKCPFCKKGKLEIDSYIIS